MVVVGVMTVVRMFVVRLLCGCHHIDNRHHHSVVVMMEDIIETIIGREIVDESDTIVDLQAYAREKWLKQMK